MSGQPAKLPADDEIGLLLLGILLFSLCIAVLLALTPVGLLSIALTLGFIWLWGRASAAIAILTVAGSYCIYTLWSGGYYANAAALVAIYAHGFENGGSARVVEFWAELLSSPKAWQMFSPIGCSCGAIVALILEDQRNSRLRRLLQSAFPIKWRPRLGVFLRARWVVATARIWPGITWGYEVDSGKRVCIRVKELKRHVMVLGTTGGGKSNTIALLMEAAIRRKIPVTFIEGKGDSDWGARICEFAKAHGTPTYFFDATGKHESCVYNPLGHGNSTSKTNRIVTLSHATQPFYRKLEIGFLQTTFKTLEFAGIESDLLTTAQYLDTQKLLALVRSRSRGNRVRAQEIADEIMAQRVAEKDIEGLRAEIRNLAWSDHAHLFDTRKAKENGQPILTLPDARKQGAFVYVGLPKLTDPEFTTSLGRLFVNDIKATAPTMGAPWLDVFDEFHAFAGEQAVDLANMGRSFGVCGVFSTISFADLERGVPQGGPAFAAQFISSVNSFIFHQVNAPTDAETAARIIGTVPELELTAQMLGESASGAASARTVREFQQHPDNVKNAEIGEAIFVNKNRHTVVRMKMLLSELSRQS